MNRHILSLTVHAFDNVNFLCVDEGCLNFEFKTFNITEFNFKNWLRCVNKLLQYDCKITPFLSFTKIISFHLRTVSEFQELLHFINVPYVSQTDQKAFQYLYFYGIFTCKYYWSLIFWSCFENIDVGLFQKQSCTLIAVSSNCYMQRGETWEGLKYLPVLRNLYFLLAFQIVIRVNVLNVKLSNILFS